MPGVQTGCYRAPPVSIPVDEEETSGGLSRQTLLAVWSSVGVIAVGGIVFVASHSISNRALKKEANDKLSQAVSSAQNWIANGQAIQGEAIENELTTAIASQSATDKSTGAAVLEQVRQRRWQLVKDELTQKAQKTAAGILSQAKRLINERKIGEAVSQLRQYTLHTNATELADAERLLLEAEKAISPTAAMSILIAMSDADFGQFKATGVFVDDQISTPALQLVWNETLKQSVDAAMQKREDARTAEQKKVEDRQAGLYFKGRVLAKSTGRPLPNSAVYLLKIRLITGTDSFEVESRQQIATDAYGMWKLPSRGLPTGYYVVSLEASPFIISNPIPVSKDSTVVDFGDLINYGR